MERARRGTTKGRTVFECAVRHGLKPLPPKKTKFKKSLILNLGIFKESVLS